MHTLPSTLPSLRSQIERLSDAARSLAESDRRDGLLARSAELSALACDLDDAALACAGVEEQDARTEEEARLHRRWDCEDTDGDTDADAPSGAYDDAGEEIEIGGALVRRPTSPAALAAREAANRGLPLRFAPEWTVALVVPHLVETGAAPGEDRPFLVSAYELRVGRTGDPRWAERGRRPHWTARRARLQRTTGTTAPAWIVRAAHLIAATATGPEQASVLAEHVRRHARKAVLPPLPGATQATSDDCDDVIELREEDRVIVLAAK